MTNLRQHIEFSLTLLRNTSRVKKSVTYNLDRYTKKNEVQMKMELNTANSQKYVVVTSLPVVFRLDALA